MAKTIPSRNDPNVVFLVDEEDYDDVMQYRWGLLDGVYAISWFGKQTVLMHRYIMGRQGDIDGSVIDHANRDGRDNRKANLRICTSSDNNANRMTQNQTGYKGVTWRSGKWLAQCSRSQTLGFVGSFGTAEEAAMAYDIRAIELFGQFALLNFSSPDPDLESSVRAKMQKAKKRKGQSSYRGVSRDHGGWKAVVKQNGQSFYLGRFGAEEEAARAVDEATVRLGHKRPLNFPST